MGQRHLTLHSTYTGFTNNTAVLHVSQLPPNPAIFAPGPALLFVIVRGIPSIGIQVMVGSGKIEEQKKFDVGVIPASAIMRAMHGEDETTPRKLTSGSIGGHTRARMWHRWLRQWPTSVVLTIFMLALGV